MAPPPAEIRIAVLHPGSQVNGPGLRAVVWLQGCPRQPPCAGCFNPEMLDAGREVERVKVASLAARILDMAGRTSLDGITLSGGEPFLQAAAAAELAADLRRRGMTVVVFSGYALEELRAAARPDWEALLGEIDLLVDGPYRQDLPCTEPLRSSTNQRLHFLSGRIRPEDVARMPPARLEITIDATGNVSCTGFPEEELLRGLRAKG